MTTTALSHLLSYARDKQLGLTSLHALAYIHLQDGEAQIGQVARHLGVTGAAITGTSDRLVALGLITRRYGKKDRRNVWLEITPNGSALIATALIGPAIEAFAEAV